MKKIFFVLASAAMLVFAGACSNRHNVYSSAVDLSAKGTANCYIVSLPGYYCFDATVIGNGAQGIIPEGRFHTDKATIVPALAGTLMNQNGVISDVRLAGGKVFFRASGNPGNAQVVVYDSAGEVLWSWHIWCTDAPATVKYTNRDQLSWEVMDRNIGAVSADDKDGEKTFGLYYQWGRKDPFTAEEVNKGMYVNKDVSLGYAVKYPGRALEPVNWKDVYDAFDWCCEHKDNTNHYLWGNPDFAYCHPLSEMKKTIYDPCPAGYVVAPSNAFIDFEVPERMEFGSNGFWFVADGGAKCFFPYAGGIYNGPKLDRPDMPVGESCALWNSASARYIYWDDGGSRSVVYKDTHEARNYYGDTRTCCYPVRCVKQAE